MNMQMFDVDIQLTNAQRNRIEKGLAKALKDDVYKNTIIINDIFIVSNALNMNLASDEEFIEIYTKLEASGGVRAVNDDEAEPDILTTYRFMVSLDRIGNSIDLDAKKSYIETLKTDEGLYKMFKSSADNYDLTAILYANTIRHMEIGGDKDDFAE